MSSLVSAKLSEDWNNVITEGQLKDLISNHQFVGPYDVITEGQLNDIGMKGNQCRHFLLSQLLKYKMKRSDTK
jgi:hypothetical protein